MPPPASLLPFSLPLHQVVVYSPPNTASSGSDDATASAPADDTRDSPAAAGGLWGSGGSGSRGRKAVSFYLSKAKKAALHGVSADMDSIIDEDPLVAAIHARAEVFDEKAEAVFSYMQVFSGALARHQGPRSARRPRQRHWAAAAARHSRHSSWRAAAVSKCRSE